MCPKRRLTNILGFAGEPSQQRSWEEVALASPDIVIVMPCGYDVARIVAEKLSLGLGQQVIIDNRGGVAGRIGMRVAAKAAPEKTAS